MTSIVKYILTIRESLGNHEFDEEVDGVVPFIRNLTCPVLAANLVLDDVPELKMEPNLYKSTVITTNNVKIGIIGYLTPDTSFLAPKNNVKYEEEVQAIKKEVQTLKEQGIEILIALGHSGFLKDLEIAEKVEDLDLVIGGHSNTFLINKNTTEIPEFSQGPYPTIVRQKSGRNVPVVQAYAYTKYLGSLHLVFDNNGEIIHFDGDPILLNNNVPEDAKLLEIVNRYKVNIDRTNNEVVGSSLKFLDGDSCRIKECNLGNLINDAVITYTKKIYKQHSNANIAITVGGRIRTSLYHPGKSFNITKGDLITVVPFSDTLCIMTINGSALLDALEHSVASWRVIDTPGQFLQMSGMDVTYDFANKVGSRVIRARAICAYCTELTDIRKENEYKVITPRFLAEGGDGYTMFVSQPREILPFNEVDCVFDYLSNHSPIEPVVSDRIVILNEDKLKNLNITNIIPNSKTGSLPRALVPSRSSSFQHNVTLFLFFCILVFLI